MHAFVQPIILPAFGGCWFTIKRMPLRSAWISFLLAFTALLPLINPIGSALVFLGLVGDEPIAVYKNLARKIAMASIVFLIVIEFLGSLILSFFWNLASPWCKSPEVPSS